MAFRQKSFFFQKNTQIELKYNPPESEGLECCCWCHVYTLSLKRIFCGKARWSLTAFVKGLNVLGRSHGDQTLPVKTTSSSTKPVFGFMFRTHLKLQEFNRKSSSRLTAVENGSERETVNTAALSFLLIVASRVDSRCSFNNSPGRSVCTQPPPLQSEIKIRCRWLVRGFLIRWVLNDRMLFKLRLNCFRPVDGKLNLYSQVVPGGRES